MFFNSFDRDVNRRLLVEAGMSLIRDEVISMREPEGDVTFQWMLARRE